MDADGIALAFWIFLALFCVLVGAGAIEWMLSRPSRRWLRRLRDIERARIDWQARVIQDQSFWRDR